MAELKTLKDLDFVEACTDPMGEEEKREFVDKNQMRQEAIKWIKDLLYGTSFEPIPMLKKEFVNRGEPTDIAVNCFKCFFNITDEELK